MHLLRVVNDSGTFGCQSVQTKWRGPAAAPKVGACPGTFCLVFAHYVILRGHSRDTGVPSIPYFGVPHLIIGLSHPNPKRCWRAAAAVAASALIWCRGQRSLTALGGTTLLYYRDLREGTWVLRYYPPHHYRPLLYDAGWQAGWISRPHNHRGLLDG